MGFISLLPGERADFALALSALPAQALEVWWKNYDAAGFSRAFKLYADALQGTGFDFRDCDPLADFARLAVEVTRDQVILRDAIRGLAELGHSHNRWHVRDVTVGILQSIRDDGAAVSALEGLRMSGRLATEWTAGPAVAGTLHPILRAGIQTSSPSRPETARPRTETAGRAGRQAQPPTGNLSG